ncbi:MAG: IS1 family transposase [Solirubrobacteraceae bacterium]
MNRISTEKRAQIIGCLVEGNSIRATVRMTGAAKNTVTKLLVDLGAACADYQAATMVDLPCTTIECDEIWAFCYSKQKNIPDQHVGTFGYGDVWTWTALCADTKLVPSWLVGERTVDDAWAFLSDLQGRLAKRVQLTSDGYKVYVQAVDLAFGDEIDFAMLHKIYGQDPAPSAARRYSPAVCTGADVRIVKGDPDPRSISTSYVERQNLTMRMGMRRFTRLTNAFSKKVENLAHAVSLHYMHYNFARVHSSLTLTNDDGTTTKRTPAMAAGVADHVWTLREIAGLLD